MPNVKNSGTKTNDKNDFYYKGKHGDTILVSTGFFMFLS